MPLSPQFSQPVPLYYGHVVIGTPVTVELASGFDYVITKLVIAALSAGAIGIIIYDESGVEILQTGANSSDIVSEGAGMLTGEMPIGPRTSLTLQAAGESLQVYLGGYALTPPTALHI